MPISSSEIAQLNGAYQQQYAQQAQFASQMSQGNIYGGGGSMGSGMQGDQLMSRGMNRAAGIGVPLAAAGMSLMGLDPFSIGLKAGGMASAAGMGMGGAIGVGAGVALPLMAGLGAAKYAGSQMMEGASQQSNLNQTLRSSFNFRNSAGGQGFQRADMTEIGSMVRDMSGQFGPGGEITGFKELTSLAGKMGTMGFAQGVRDVKEFSSKFKEMVTTLKGMAKDLGTTLEGAMEFAQAAKGSGVFGMGNMAKFTSSVTQGSKGTGLAVSEFTGAASIGSQIARSIGGLGKQGSAAGIRTMDQIGTAQKMGTLSEEDIYNVTGLTGAEGRQAYAASSMQKAGSFLQSGRGRRTLAALAGKDGKLDEEGVQTLLSGGMDIGETMRRDNKMKTTVGRANFIRNEGRLRGAALERIGGFLPALQLKEWAESKGVDINNMDDRSMLFAQRQLGMGRDEVDQAVKMANALPAIARKMQRTSEDTTYFDKLAQEHKQQGIEGIQNRFDQAKEKVNNKLQEAGQRLFNSGSEALDRWLNKLTGTYEHVMTERADDAIRAAAYGGASSKQELAAQLGVGANPFGSKAAAGFGGNTGLTNKGARGRLDALNPVSEMRTTVSRFEGMGDMNAEGRAQARLLESLPGMSTISEIIHGKSPQQRFKEAGYDVAAKSDDDLQVKLKEVRDKLSAKASAGTLTDKEKDLMQGDLLRPGVGLSGGERQKAFGEAILGEDKSWKGSALGTLAGTLFGGGLGANLGGWVGGKIESSISGRDEKVGAAGRYATSEEGARSAFALFGGAGSKVAKEQEASMNAELTELKKNGNGQGTRAVELAQQLVAKAYAEGGGDSISDERVKDITERYGATGIKTTREGMREVYGAVVSGVTSQQQKVREEEARRISTRAQKEMDKEKELGIEVGVSGPDFIKGGKVLRASGLSPAADDAAQTHAKGLAARAGFIATGDPEKDKAAYGRMIEDEQNEMSSLAHMSEASRKELATKYAGTSYGSMVSGINADEKRIEKGLKRGRKTETMLSGVGLSMSKEDMKTMNMKDPESQKRLEQYMMENLGTGKGGIGEDALKKEIQTLMSATKSGNVGDIFQATKSIQEDPEYQKKQKQQKDEQEDQNPAVREAKKQTSILEKMLKFQGMTASEISELNDKAQAGSAEDTGGGGSFHNGPNKGRGP